MAHIKTFQGFLNETVYVIEKSLRAQIEDAVRAGYNQIKIGYITPKRKGIALVNDKSQVMGTYPLDYQEAIQAIIDSLA